MRYCLLLLLLLPLSVGCSSSDENTVIDTSQRERVSQDDVDAMMAEMDAPADDK